MAATLVTRLRYNLASLYGAGRAGRPAQSERRQSRSLHRADTYVARPRLVVDKARILGYLAAIGAARVPPLEGYIRSGLLRQPFREMGALALPTAFRGGVGREARVPPVELRRSSSCGL